MAQKTEFMIRNDQARSLILNIEPEGAFFALKAGEEVTVVDRFTERPVTVTFTNSEKGESVLSIWPGDGEVRVEKNGMDVLELIQEGLGV